MITGRSTEVNYCIACGSCSQLLRAQAQTGCPIYFEYYKKLLKEIQKDKA
jgi:hypothetical protein